MKRKYLQLLLGILISAIFIYLALPGLHLNEVAASLRTANYWWIVPGVIVYFIGLWVRSWRWHYMLRHLKPVSTQRLYPLVCIGYFGNNVYPFRAGEVIRSVMLRKQEGIAVSSSLATVFIERIFDGLTMLLFVFLALPFAPMPANFRNLVVAMTVLFLGVTLLFVWAAVRPAVHLPANNATGAHSFGALTQDRPRTRHRIEHDVARRRLRQHHERPGHGRFQRCRQMRVLVRALRQLVA